MRLFRPLFVATTLTLALVGCKEPLAEGDIGWSEAYQSGDAAALAALYAEDAALLPPNQQMVTGREAIQKSWGAMIDDGLAAEADFAETGSDGDLGYKVGTYVLKDPEGGALDEGKFVEVWKRVDGEWMLYRDIYNSSLPPAPNPLSQDDADAVTTIMKAAAQRLQDGDFQSWAALFAEDAVLMPPNHPAVKGRAAIQAHGETFPNMTKVEFSDVQVQGRDDLAVATSAISMTIAPEGQPEVQEIAKQVVVFAKQADGSWSATAVSYSSDLAPPAPEGEASKGETPEGEAAPATP